VSHWTWRELWRGERDRAAIYARTDDSGPKLDLFGLPVERRVGKDGFDADLMPPTSIQKENQT
jgi:hypothetical protein